MVVVGSNINVFTMLLSTTFIFNDIAMLLCCCSTYDISKTTAFVNIQHHTVWYNTIVCALKTDWLSKRVDAEHKFFHHVCKVCII